LFAHSIIWATIIVVALLITLIALPIDIAFYTQPEAHDKEHGEPHNEPDKPHNNSGHVEVKEDAHADSNEHEPSAFGHTMSREKYFWFMSNFICELFFIFDIFLDFRSGYVDEETDEVMSLIYQIRGATLVIKFKTKFMIHEALKLNNKYSQHETNGIVNRHMVQAHYI